MNRKLKIMIHNRRCNLFNPRSELESDTEIYGSKPWAVRAETRHWLSDAILVQHDIIMSSLRAIEE